MGRRCVTRGSTTCLPKQRARKLVLNFQPRTSCLVAESTHFPRVHRQCGKLARCGPHQPPITGTTVSALSRQSSHTLTSVPFSARWHTEPGGQRSNQHHDQCIHTCQQLQRPLRLCPSDSRWLWAARRAVDGSVSARHAAAQNTEDGIKKRDETACSKKLYHTRQVQRGGHTHGELQDSSVHTHHPKQAGGGIKNNRGGQGEAPPHAGTRVLGPSLVPAHQTLSPTPTRHAPPCASKRRRRRHVHRRPGLGRRQRVPLDPRRHAPRRP